MNFWNGRKFIPVVFTVRYYPKLTGYGKKSHGGFDVDVIGGLNIKKKFGHDALAIFIQAPSIEELQKRLIGRATDTLEKIEERVNKALYEMSFAPQFDTIIVNDQLETALSNAEKTVREFLSRP